MHAIFANATAVLLLVQAVSGSCWQKSSECEVSASIASVACAQCCNYHCDQSPLSETSKNPCGCKLECSGICNYTLPDQVPEQELGSTWVSFVSIEVMDLMPHLRAEVATWFRESWHPVSSGPLRLHLLHQIILI
jgi:hypothetical protein